MAKTIAGLQLEVESQGPWLARKLKGPADKCVELIVKHWDTLRASSGENKWAVEQIKQETTEGLPTLYSIIIKIMVSILINWFLTREKEFRKEVSELKTYLSQWRQI